METSNFLTNKITNSLHMSTKIEKQPLLLHENNSNFENIQTNILYPNIPEDIQETQSEINENQSVTTKKPSINSPNIPKTGKTPLDSFIEDPRVPVLTEPEAITGLILNVIFPGLGTIYYGLVSKDTFQITIGIIQTFLSFILIGCFWALFWSIIVYLKAKNKKILFKIKRLTKFFI